MTQVEPCQDRNTGHRHSDSTFELWSGRRDSNSRPSVPQTDALTKLRHVPLPAFAGSLSLAQPQTRRNEHARRPTRTLLRLIDLFLIVDGGLDAPDPPLGDRWAF